ncbi:unnamed protein product [Closterium sp. NIES-65]|nr:unnamed protein product [Closterium sp. NIES-65]
MMTAFANHILFSPDMKLRPRIGIVDDDIPGFAETSWNLLIRHGSDSPSLDNLAVKQQASVLTRLSHGYNWLLRLNNVAFVLLIMAAPVLLALIFTPLFLTLASGFAFPPDSPEFESLHIHTILSGPLAPPLDQWERASRAGPAAVALCWVCAALVRAGQQLYVVLHFFLFALAPAGALSLLIPFLPSPTLSSISIPFLPRPPSLSLCTTFGGSPLQVLSPSALMLANLLTLLAQLNFVFLSGAVFARIGRPAETVRCSRFITLATQPLTGHGTEKRRILTARFALVGLNSHELVNVKVALSLRLFLPSPSGVVHCSLHDLELVKSDLPYMRFGFNLRHIVDESSPLHGLSLSNLLAADASFSLTISGLERTTMQPVFVVKVSQRSQRESMGVKASPLHSLSLSDLLAADASFSLTISGLERSSMQPVFVVKEYYAYDGEVLWDYKFLHLLCAPCHLPLNHSLCPLHCTPLHSCSLHALHTAVFCTLLLHCRSTIAYEEYYAYDGEVLWDYEFLDLIRIASDLVPTLDHSRLDAVTPVNTHS